MHAIKANVPLRGRPLKGLYVTNEDGRKEYIFLTGLKRIENERSVGEEWVRYIARNSEKKRANFP